VAIGLPRRVAATLRSPALAPVALALLLHGLSQGMTVPLLALWIVRAYGRGPGAIAAYFACTAAGGLALNPLLGRLSDRLSRRRETAALAGLLQTAGLATLALHPSFGIVLAAAGLLLAAQVQPHLFALVNDHIGQGSPEFPRAFTVATVRGAISAAWVIGAPLGGLLAGRGMGLTFGVAAVLSAASIAIVLLRCREGPFAAPRRPLLAAPGPPPRWGQLGLFGLGALLAVAGNTAKMQAVPLYLQRLGVPMPGIGLAYSWMALAELVALPPWGALADRIPRRRAVALGLLGGTAFFAAIALAPGTLAVVVAFPAMALLVAGLYGVGIGYAQDLDPRHVGLAGGVFFAAQGLGQVAGGPLVAFGQSRLGLPHAFLVPALAILAGALAVSLSHPAPAAAVAAAPGQDTRRLAARG